MGACVQDETIQAQEELKEAVGRVGSDVDNTLARVSEARACNCPGNFAACQAVLGAACDWKAAGFLIKLLFILGWPLQFTICGTICMTSANAFGRSAARCCAWM